MAAYRSKSAFSVVGRLTVSLTGSCFGSGPKRSFVAIALPVDKKRPVWPKRDVSIHHDPHRHAWPDRERGLNVEIAPGDFLSDLVHGVLHTVARRDHHRAIAAALVLWCG